MLAGSSYLAVWVSMLGAPRPRHQLEHSAAQLSWFVVLNFLSGLQFLYNLFFLLWIRDFGRRFLQCCGRSQKWANASPCRWPCSIETSGCQLMAFAAHSVNLTTVALRIPSFWRHLVSLKSSSKLQSQNLRSQERTQKSANASRRNSMRALDSSTLQNLLPSTHRKILKILGSRWSPSSSEAF